MTIIGLNILHDFKRKHADARSQINAMEAELNIADWCTPQDIKQRYPMASILSNNQVIFDIKGNKYRILAQVNYKNKIILIKNAGNHNEYMKW